MAATLGPALPGRKDPETGLRGGRTLGKTLERGGPGEKTLGGVHRERGGGGEGLGAGILGRTEPWVAEKDSAERGFGGADSGSGGGGMGKGSCGED